MVSHSEIMSFSWAIVLVASKLRQRRSDHSCIVNVLMSLEFGLLLSEKWTWISFVSGHKGYKGRTWFLYFTLVKKKCPLILFFFRGRHSWLWNEMGRIHQISFHFLIEFFPLSVPRSSFPSLPIVCLFFRQLSLPHSFSYILSQDLTLSGVQLDSISISGMVSGVLTFTQHVNIISAILIYPAV
jgi:hypothetical protein